MYRRGNRGEQAADGQDREATPVDVFVADEAEGEREANESAKLVKNTKNCLERMIGIKNPYLHVSALFSTKIYISRVFRGEGLLSLFLAMPRRIYKSHTEQDWHQPGLPARAGVAPSLSYGITLRCARCWLMYTTRISSTPY